MSIDPARALQRSIAVAQLDVPTFEEVEADYTSTDEAGAVVVAASAIGAIGGLFSNGLWGLIAFLLIQLIGWFVWAWLSAYIAERVFEVQTTDTSEMLRTTGYAYGPRVIGIIPWIGWIIGFVWSVIAIVVGMREAAELSTTQAVITTLVGIFPATIAMLIVMSIL